MTKMEAVRRALAELGNDAMPLEIRKLIKSKLGIDMDPNMISSYKSSLTKKVTGQSAVIRKPGGRTAAATGGFSLEDIQAVKEVVARVGADKVRELAEVLSK
jgi:hypothetical protein